MCTGDALASDLYNMTYLQFDSLLGSAKLQSFYVHNSILGAGGASRELCVGVLPAWVSSLLLRSVPLPLPGSTSDCGPHPRLPDKEGEDTHPQRLKVCCSTGLHLKCRFCGPRSCHFLPPWAHKHQQWDILCRDYATSNHLSYSHVCTKGME